MVISGYERGEHAAQAVGRCHQSMSWRLPITASGIGPRE